MLIKSGSIIVIPKEIPFWVKYKQKKKKKSMCAVIHILQKTNMKESLVTELLIENAGSQPLNKLSLERKRS